jgi:hypothetical protein
MATRAKKKKIKNNNAAFMAYCNYISYALLTGLDKRNQDKPAFSNIEDVGETFAEKAPRTKEQLAVYCAVVLNNRFPHPSSNDKYCIENGHMSPLDAIWGAYSETDTFSIWYAMRGSGKTYDLAILSFLESLFKPKCWTTILGGSLEQSTKAVSYLNDLWNMPALINTKGKFLVNGEVAGRGYKTTHGSQVQALAASTKSVRGPHPQKLRLDEVDEMDKVIYEGALGQPKSKFGILDNVIISSTLHNAFGLMSEIIDDREKLNATFYPWCINEVLEPRGFWSQEEYKRKVAQCTIAMIDAEYKLKRPKIGDTIFDFDSIDRAYRRGINEKYDNSVYTEAGLDWGYACTALSIVQDPREIFKNTITTSFEYIELKKRCNEISKICIERKISRIYCDSNPKDSNITLKKTLLEHRCNTEVVIIAFNKWKEIGINVLRYLLEKNLLNITDKTAQEKMKKYHFKNPELGIIEKEDDHIPDSLIAWASSRYKILGI